jgi:hypothetical protein
MNRRDFLVAGAASVAGVALPLPTLLASESRGGDGDLPTFEEIQSLAAECAKLEEYRDPIHQLLPVGCQDRKTVVWESCSPESLPNLHAEKPGTHGRATRDDAGRPSWMVFRSYECEPQPHVAMRPIRKSDIVPVGRTLRDTVLARVRAVVEERYNGIRQHCWSVLTGRVTPPGGPSRFHVSTPWDQPGGSPLKSLRDICSGSSLGGQSVAYCNGETYQDFLNATGLDESPVRGTPESHLLRTLRIHAKVADWCRDNHVPHLKKYISGYTWSWNPAGLIPFIPTGMILATPQSAVGEYVIAQPDDMLQNFTKRHGTDSPLLGARPCTFLRRPQTKESKPDILEVWDVHSGLPAVYYPGRVNVMWVGAGRRPW